MKRGRDLMKKPAIPLPRPTKSKAGWKRRDELMNQLRVRTYFQFLKTNERELTVAKAEWLMKGALEELVATLANRERLRKEKRSTR